VVYEQQHKANLFIFGEDIFYADMNTRCRRPDRYMSSCRPDGNEESELARQAAYPQVACEAEHEDQLQYWMFVRETYPGFLAFSIVLHKEMK
jgi:hypothetical protein